MEDAHAPRPDAADRNDLVSEAVDVVSPAATPPFDWHVLLLRYLPRPVGSTHVIKRLAPR